MAGDADWNQVADGEPWEDARAADLEGALVLVGLTFQRPEGETREQLFGVVMQATRDAGITLRLGGSRAGEFYTLPPDLGAFEPADPGIYTLTETGDTVEDPDFIATWVISGPPN